MAKKTARRFVKFNYYADAREKNKKKPSINELLVARNVIYQIPERFYTIVRARTTP